MEHTSRPCEPNVGYLPLCLDTNAGNDTFFQSSWIPVPFNVHYQQNTLELQHFLPMFRYSVQNSYSNWQRAKQRPKQTCNDQWPMTNEQSKTNDQRSTNNDQ